MMLTNLILDVNQSLRALARQPGIALVLIFTLALGIGASISVFSLANSFLVRPPAGPESHPFMTESFSKTVGFFALIAGAVLLVSCAKITGVLLARAGLVARWITETTILALLGGTAGLAIALWAADAWGFLAPLCPDAKTVGFALLSSLLVGFLASSAPLHHQP